MSNNLSIVSAIDVRRYSRNDFTPVDSPILFTLGKRNKTNVLLYNNLLKHRVLNVETYISLLYEPCATLLPFVVYVFLQRGMTLYIYQLTIVHYITNASTHTRLIRALCLLCNVGGNKIGPNMYSYGTLVVIRVTLLYTHRSIQRFDKRPFIFQR